MQDAAIVGHICQTLRNEERIFVGQHFGFLLLCERSYHHLLLPLPLLWPLLLLLLLLLLLWLGRGWLRRRFQTGVGGLHGRGVGQSVGWIQMAARFLFVVQVEEERKESCRWSGGSRWTGLSTAVWTKLECGISQEELLPMTAVPGSRACVSFSSRLVLIPRGRIRGRSFEKDPMTKMCTQTPHQPTTNNCKGPPLSRTPTQRPTHHPRTDFIERYRLCVFLWTSANLARK